MTTSTGNAGLALLSGTPAGTGPGPAPGELPPCGCFSSPAVPVGPATPDGLGRDDSDDWNFVAPAVHQLRTPLTSIISFADLLLSRRGTAADRLEWTGHICSQALRMKASLNSFLCVSEIETGTLVLKPAPVDVESVCDEITRVASAAAPGVRVACRVSPGARQVQADETRFREMLWNLVDNAVKYSRGGPVAISASPDGAEMIRVEVSDRGPGIPAERIPGLFNAFTRAGGGREPRGTGLGLYLVKNLAEMHGGSVTVDSVVGEGTTFTLRLPALPAHPAARKLPLAGATGRAGQSKRDPGASAGEFMRHISYDLRAPLTPLLAAAELLAEPTAPGELRGQWLRRIRTLAVRMKCVTDAVMTASHLRSGAAAFDSRPFDVSGPLAAVMAQTGPLLEDRRLGINIEPDARHLMGDPQRLADVVAALVESAARDSCEGSDIAISAHPAPTGGEAAVCVTFMPRPSPGTGRGGPDEPAVGLRVASQLARLQGASVAVCGMRGGPATYRVSLPHAG